MTKKNIKENRTKTIQLGISAFLSPAHCISSDPGPSKTAVHPMLGSVRNTARKPKAISYIFNTDEWNGLNFSKQDILQRTCTRWPLCKESDSCTLAESPPQNRAHMIRSLILTKDQPEQEPSSSLSGADHENHIICLLWDGISHSWAFHSVHIHKDGLSIIKYLENSASYNIIYILGCTKQKRRIRLSLSLRRCSHLYLCTPALLYITTAVPPVKYKALMSSFWNKKTKTIQSGSVVESMLKLGPQRTGGVLTPSQLLLMLRG